MTEEWKKVPKGSFKGKKFEFAPTTGVDMFGEIAADFMQKIFHFSPEDYLITDESSLYDFELEVEIEDIRKQIQQEYDFDSSEIESGNLFEIFAKIHQQKYGAPG